MGAGVGVGVGVDVDVDVDVGVGDPMEVDANVLPGQTPSTVGKCRCWRLGKPKCDPSKSECACTTASSKSSTGNPATSDDYCTACSAARSQATREGVKKRNQNRRQKTKSQTKAQPCQCKNAHHCKQNACPCQTTPGERVQLSDFCEFCIKDYCQCNGACRVGGAEECPCALGTREEATARKVGTGEKATAYNLCTGCNQQSLREQARLAKKASDDKGKCWGV